MSDFIKTITMSQGAMSVIGAVKSGGVWKPVDIQRVSSHGEVAEQAVLMYAAGAERVTCLFDLDVSDEDKEAIRAWGRERIAADKASKKDGTKVEGIDLSNVVPLGRA